MNKKLIKTENYLLVVDDSEIKTWYYDEYSKKVHHSGGAEYSRNDITKNIVAHLPLNGYGILEGVPLLPPLEIEDDIEKLNENLFDKGSDNVLHPQYQMRIFFNMGYNKAREKYSLSNIIDLYIEETGYGMDMWSKEENETMTTIAKIIEYLSQPKTPTHFEFEMESMTIDEIREQGKGFLHASTFKIKTTNSQGQQVACGKYLY